MNDNWSKQCAKCGTIKIYKHKSSWVHNKNKLCVKCSSDGGYSKEEESFLIENYSKLGRDECAKILNRTSFSVGVKTSKLGLRSLPSPKDIINNKICGRCKLELNKSEFGTDNRRKDKKHPICKNCLTLDRTTPDKKLNKKKYDAIYVKNKMKTDPKFRLVRSIRRRFKKLLKLKNIKKQTSAIKLIGCSIVELKLYLEKQFKHGMSWNNYGNKGWHIDHIKPCASFDLNNIEQQQQCFHYTNLQPLWWYENLSKGTNIN